MDAYIWQPRRYPRLARRSCDWRARRDAYRPLPPSTVARLHADLRVVLTFHSNAIQGNTLSLRETQLVVVEQITQSRARSVQGRTVASPAIGTACLRRLRGHRAVARRLDKPANPLVDSG